MQLRKIYKYEFNAEKQLPSRSDIEKSLKKLEVTEDGTLDVYEDFCNYIKKYAALPFISSIICMLHFAFGTDEYTLCVIKPGKKQSSMEDVEIVPVV